MSEARPYTAPTARQSAAIAFLLLMVVAVPVAITLATVEVVRPKEEMRVEITPHGYTVSLIIFVVPIVVIGGWLIPRERLKIPRIAFLITAGAVFLAGAALDFLFAHRFFFFPNRGATLGIEARVIGGTVPIEEYAFYLLAAVALLLMYIWYDEFWLHAYQVVANPPFSSFHFHWPSLVGGALLVAAAWVYKNFFTDHPGFPDYFTFLMTIIVAPTAGWLPAVRSLINWRAFGATMMGGVLTSLLLEATLAIPYGWWAYKPQAMIGITVNAWSGLPIEAVMLWVAITYAATVAYAIVRAAVQERYKTA